MKDKRENGQAGAEVTPAMIARGKEALSHGFGSVSENPCTDYDEVAEAVFREMIFVSSQRRPS
jgi:hypothetical protein